MSAPVPERTYPGSDILDCRTPAEAADDMWHAVFQLLDVEMGGVEAGDLAGMCARAVRRAREKAEA